MRFTGLCLLVLATQFCFSGCTTTRTTNTSRTGIEQLLISNAVDQTIAKTDLPPVEGRKVFLDDKYFDAIDKGYVVGSLRQKLLANGAMLVDKKEDSEVTIEMCSGGVGTDSVESYVGVPGLTMPGLPIELPEVRMYEKKSQFGMAKISVVSYDTKTGSMIHDGGRSLARADDSRWNVLGIGPFQSGTVRDEVNYNTGEMNLGTRVANRFGFSEQR